MLKTSKKNLVALLLIGSIASCDPKKAGDDSQIKDFVTGLITDYEGLYNDNLANIPGDKVGLSTVTANADGTFQVTGIGFYEIMMAAPCITEYTESTAGNPTQITTDSGTLRDAFDAMDSEVEKGQDARAERIKYLKGINLLMKLYSEYQTAMDSSVDFSLSVDGSDFDPATHGSLAAFLQMRMYSNIKDDSSYSTPDAIKDEWNNIISD